MADEIMPQEGQEAPQESGQPRNEAGQFVAKPEEGATEAPNPWAPWESAGLTPDKLYDVQQANAWYQGVQNPAERDWHLQRLLQSQQVLPEGADFSDVLQRGLEAWQAEQDPLAPYTSAEQQEADAQGITVEQLREGWRADMRSEIQQFQQQLTEQQNAQRFEMEFGNALNGLQREHSLDQEDVDFIAGQAILAFQNGSVQSGTPVESVIKGEFDRMTKYLNARLAKMAQGQGRAPQSQALPSQGTPAESQPGKGLHQIADEMAKSGAFRDWADSVG